MLQPSHHTAKSYRTPQVAAGALFGAKRQVAPPLRPFPSEVSLGTQQGLVDGRGTRALEVPVFRRAGAHNNVTHAADYVVQPVPHNDSFEASAVLGRNVEKETRTIDPKRDRLSVAPPPVARVPGLQEFSAARMSNAMSGAANWPTHLSDADMGRVARTVMAPAGKAVPQAPVVVVPDPTRRLVAPTLHPRTVTVAAAVRGDAGAVSAAATNY